MQTDCDRRTFLGRLAGAALAGLAARLGWGALPARAGVITGTTTAPTGLWHASPVAPTGRDLGKRVFRGVDASLYLEIDPRDVRRGDRLLLTHRAEDGARVYEYLTAASDWRPPRRPSDHHLGSVAVDGEVKIFRVPPGRLLVGRSWRAGHAGRAGRDRVT